MKEKWLSSRFLKFMSLKQLCQASESFVILCGILAKTLTLEAHRKFFMHRTLTFRVYNYKTFSKITGTQRILNGVCMMHSCEHLIVNRFSYHFKGGGPRKFPLRGWTLLPLNANWLGNSFDWFHWPKKESIQYLQNLLFSVEKSKKSSEIGLFFADNDFVFFQL